MRALPAMEVERLGAIPAARLSERCGATMNGRLRIWSEAMQRDVQRARTPGDLRQALRNARRRLDPLWAFASSDLLLPDLADALVQGLEQAVETAQDEAQRNARRLGDPGELTLRILREQPLTRRLDIDLPEHPAPAAGSMPTRRTILLG
ncbi:MAG: hypothetical protein LC713_05900 [Actinobacteria bacterium]|nr:hypothetical protein [Actinomycetota bacterium]